MTAPVTADTLNGVIEFNCPFQVLSESSINTRLPDVWAPEVFLPVDDDGQAIGPPETWDGWEFIDGYSGQYRYSGPCMHASEYLGGRMADDVLADVGGVYVVCDVYPVDDSEPDSWVLLRRIEGVAR